MTSLSTNEIGAACKGRGKVDAHATSVLTCWQLMSIGFVTLIAVEAGRVWDLAAGHFRDVRQRIVTPSDPV